MEQNSHTYMLYSDAPAQENNVWGTKCLGYKVSSIEIFINAYGQLCVGSTNGLLPGRNKYFLHTESAPKWADDVFGWMAFSGPYTSLRLPVCTLERLTLLS